MLKLLKKKGIQMKEWKLLKWMNFILSQREKNRIYVITLVSRDKRQIVGYDIAFDKSRNRIQNLVDSSPKADRYYSDAYPAYSEILYDGLHTSLKNKSQTYTVEGVNSDLRHYIPPLKRRSKCFFRSIDTAKSVFKIFVYAFNNFSSAKFISSTSKSHLFLSMFI